MLGELLKAIKSRWTAKALGDSFAGGLDEGQSVPSSVTPRVVLTILGNTRSGFATDTTSNSVKQFELATVDFTIHCKSGLSATSALAETLKDAYDSMRATLGSSVKLTRFYFVGESIVDDPDHPNVKEWTITYEALLEASRPAVNA